MKEKIRKIELAEKILWCMIIICFTIALISTVAYAFNVGYKSAEKTTLLFILIPAILAQVLDTVRWRLFFWGWRLEDQIKKEGLIKLL